MKAKLMAAIATGTLDLEQHPELIQACMEQLKMKPLSREKAREIMKAIE